MLPPPLQPFIFHYLCCWNICRFPMFVRLHVFCYTIDLLYYFDLLCDINYSLWIKMLIELCLIIRCLKQFCSLRNISVLRMTWSMLYIFIQYDRARRFTLDWWKGSDKGHSECFFRFSSVIFMPKKEYRRPLLNPWWFWRSLKKN